jgi:hypothetical protein
MEKPQICMFCRYRRRRGVAAEACCAGAELSRPEKNAAGPAAQGMARAMPDRLRSSTLPRQQPR